MKVNDAISGGIVIVVAGLIFYFTRDFRLMPGQDYGAAFFPRVIASAMGLLGLVLVFQGLRATPREAWAAAPAWFSSPRHIGNFALVVALLVFYILASDRLGFLITGFLCVFLLLLWLRGRQHWLTSLAISVICVLGLQIFFSQLLRVPLPWGVLQEYAW